MENQACACSCLQSFEFSDLHALLPPVVGSGPNTPSAAQAHTQPEEGEASASFPDDPAPAPHARAFQQRTAAHSPSPLSRAAGPSVQSVGMAAAAAAKATAALVVPNAHVEEGPEEELLSLQGVSPGAFLELCWSFPQPVREGVCCCTHLCYHALYTTVGTWRGMLEEHRPCV